MIPLQTLEQYCNFGWRILPTWYVIEVDGKLQCACERGVRCTKPGKHPRIRAWETQATNDFDVVRSWHTAWPEANWGWLQDKTFTIDVDAHRGGLESLAEWETEVGGPDTTLTQYTPNGGIHFIYRQPAHALTQLDDFIPGIEVRGSKSYIMIAPSSSIVGSWTWKTCGDPELIAECDALTLSLIHDKLRGGSRRRSAQIGNNSLRLPPTTLFMVHGFGFHSGSRNRDAYNLMWRLLGDLHRNPMRTMRDVQHVMRCIFNVTPQGTEEFSWEECVGCMRSACERFKRQTRENEQRNKLLLSRIRTGLA